MFHFFRNIKEKRDFSKHPSLEGEYDQVEWTYDLVPIPFLGGNERVYHSKTEKMVWVSKNIVIFINNNSVGDEGCHEFFL